MAHHLTGCVLVPHFPVQVARRASTPCALPLVVATGVSSRAVVVDLCAQAARRGVRAGMSVFEARRRIASLQVKVSDVLAVEGAAARIEAVLQSHADTVLCIASGYWTLPLPALGAGFAQAEAVAARLRAEIRARTGFACVLGVAAQPAIARLAATTAEHGLGYHIVRPGDEPAFLAPLPVRALPGVGAGTEATLARLGITTVGQLALVEEAILATLCGSRARQLARAARGLIAEQTSPEMTSITRRWVAGDEPGSNRGRLRARVYALATEVGRSLRAHDQAAGSLTVHVTWTDGTLSRHAIRWRRRSDLDRELAAAGRAALDTVLHQRRLAVREMALTANDLGPIQGDLLAGDDSRARRLQQALDGIAHRYGANAVQPGSVIGLAEEIRHAVP